MELELIENEITQSLEVAMTSIALFEQYEDSIEKIEFDTYENLYPNVA